MGTEILLLDVIFTKMYALGTTPVTSNNLIKVSSFFELIVKVKDKPSLVYWIRTELVAHHRSCINSETNWTRWPKSQGGTLGQLPLLCTLCV